MRIGSPAFTFVLTMGVVNLFGDITYEGGGSINGPFMATLGASALAVSITAGAGEVLGYRASPVCGILRGQDWQILADHVCRLCNQLDRCSRHGACRQLASG